MTKGRRKHREPEPPPPVPGGLRREMDSVREYVRGYIASVDWSERPPCALEIAESIYGAIDNAELQIALTLDGLEARIRHRIHVAQMLAQYGGPPNDGPTT